MSQIIQRQLVCVALNDAAYFEHMHATFNEAPHKTPPTEPVLYFKPRNTWSADGATFSGNSESDLVVGASIGLVIGKDCCRVAKAEAKNYLKGITLVHDFSLPEKSYYRPDIKGKCLDGSAPVGSKVVAVESFENLTVTTSVNGEEKASLAVKQLLRSPEELIEKISRIMTLVDGDVVAVGFIGNRISVSAGDTVQSNVNDLLSLTNKVGS